MGILRGGPPTGDKPNFKQVTIHRIVSIVVLLFLAGFIACIPLSTHISRIGVSQQSADLSALAVGVYGFGICGIIWSSLVLIISLMMPGGKMHFPYAEKDLETATNIFDPLFQKYIDLRPDQKHIIKEIVNKSRRWGYTSLGCFWIGFLIVFYLPGSEFPSIILLFSAIILIILGLMFMLPWAVGDSSKKQRMTFLLANRDEFYQNLRNSGYQFSNKPGSPMYPGEGALITKLPENDQDPEMAKIPSFFSAARAMGYYYQNNKSEILYFLMFLFMTCFAVVWMGVTGAGIISFITWGIITIAFGVLLVISGIRLTRQSQIVINVKLCLKIALRTHPALVLLPEDFEIEAEN